MATVRKLRISRACDVRKWPIRQFPILRLKGLWLKALSWDAGMCVNVEADENCIVIRKIHGSEVAVSDSPIEPCSESGSVGINQTEIVVCDHADVEYGKSTK